MPTKLRWSQCVFCHDVGSMNVGCNIYVSGSSLASCLCTIPYDVGDGQICAFERIYTACNVRVDGFFVN